MINHPASATYTFDDCVIDTAKHEVFLRGVPQALAPLTFTLLVYLIEHRDRVVTKEELVTNVWGGTFLSASAIARAVMKVRQAVGDRADESTSIRTVHRVGYRFVASLALGGHSSATTAAAELPPPRPCSEALVTIASTKLRLAVLPFRNLTGDRGLEWMKFGLMSLVNQALEADERLHVASVPSVLSALQAEPTDAHDDVSTARFLSQMMGVQCACGVTVTRTDGGIAFDYRLANSEGILQAGRLEGSDPTTLCQQFIRQLAADLLDGRVNALQSDDPWVNQTFARAMQAFQLKNGKSALRLIRVVLELEPGNSAVRHGLLEILCQLGKPEAKELGEVLLREALDLGDHRRAADVHRLLATVTFHLQGESPSARRHSDESVRLAGPINASYRTQQIYNDAASAAYRRGDLDRARDLYQKVELASAVTGNDVQRLIAVACRASIDAIGGNLMEACHLWEACLPQFEALNQRSRVMLMRCNLSQAFEWKGLQEIAIQHADALVALLPTSQIRWFNLRCLSHVCTRYADARRLDKIEHAILTCGLPLLDLTSDELLHAEVIGVLRHFCKNEFDVAVVKLRPLVNEVVERNDIEFASIWAPILVHGEMRAGRYADAEATAVGLLQISTLNTSPDLPGMRLHARALDLHARGHRAAARELLTEALKMMKPNRWGMLARLDAAWLNIERGDLEAAEEVLAETFFWLHAHPSGQFVNARLQFALGNRENALVAMKSCVEFFQPDQEFCGRTLEHYIHDCRGLDLDEVPNASRLPSTI